MTLDWFKFTQIADKFQYKAKFEDREDLRQDIILNLPKLPVITDIASLMKVQWFRIASYVVLSYWRDIKRKPSMLKLSSEIEDDDGNSVELWQTLKDDNAIDLEAWQDARTWLLGCPRRLVQIAV